MNPVVENDIKEIVEHSREHLEFLDGLNILLAGSTGFVGSWLLGAFMGANKYLGTKIEVTALHRGGATRIALDGLPEEYISYYGYNYGEDLDTEGRDYDVLIDTVLCSNVDPGYFLADTLTGVASLISVARYDVISRVMYISSGAVEISRSEYSPMEAAYAMSKVTGEFMYSKLGGKGYSLVIPRLYSFMGPGLSTKYALPFFMEQGRLGKDIEVASPRAARSYMYPVDMVDWLLAALVMGRDRAPYSIGTDSGMTMYEAGNKVADLYGVSYSEPNGHEGIDNSYYIPDVSKEEAELGVSQTVSFEKGLRRWKEYLT